MNNKRQKLYDNLIGTGRVSDAEIGTLDEFRSAIKDEKTARQFHKNLLGAGFDEDEIGTEDEFYNSISSDFAENKPKSEPYTHVYGADGSLIGGTAYQGGNVIPKITKENIGSMGFVQDEASALYPMSSTRLQPITSLDGKLRGTEQAEKEFNQAMEEKEIDKYFVPKQMNTEDDVYENFATRFTNTQEGVTLNEGIAKKTKEIQDKYLKDYMSSKEFAELSKQYKGEEFQKKANEQFQFMYGDKIENELKPINEDYSKAINARYGKQINDELSRIAKNDASTELTRISKSTDEALDSVEEQIKKRRRQLRNDNWKPGHPMDVARNDNMLSELNVEHSYLSTAQNLNDDSMKVLEAAKKEKDGTFIGGLGRGVADSVFDIDTWTMGITGMVDEMRLNNVLTKSEKGEKLTDAEKNLLDACVNNMAINHYYGSDLGYGYQAGKITGESLPFMLEFLINPVSASGKTLAKRILTWGLKNNIKGMSTKGAKMAARFLGDAIAAGGVTLSSGAGMVGEGTVERLNRNFKFSNDDNGNLVVTNTGEISTGEAFGKSLTSAFLERQSEMIFNAFRPLKGKPVNTLAERMQWHGLAEEQLEEVYNNFMNIPLGEMTLEEATSLEQNLITFLGLAPTQVAFSAWGGVGYAVERYNAKKKIREAYGALTPEQQDKLKELEELAKDHRNRDIAMFLSETLKDKSLTQEQKRAELEYAYNLVVNNAIEEAEEAETQSRVEADNASIDAATDTQTGNYAQVTAILSDGLGGTKEVVGNVVGWIGDSPMFVPDGMEVTEENKIPLQPGQWNPETLIARPAEEVKAINEDIIREEVAAQAERESKYAPEVLDKPMPEGQFVSNGKLYIPYQSTPDGVEYEVYELDEKGKPTTTIALEVKQLTIDDYHDMLQADLEAQEAVQAEIAQSESVGEQVNAPVNTEVNNPMENAESTPMSEEVQSATEEKSTQPVIPTKEDGSIDFVAYGREGTLKTLGEKYGEKLPNKVAVTAKALAEDVVKAEEKLAKAEEAYDNAPIGREQKAEQARDKARQELEEVKKEAEYWKAIDEEIKEAQKARETIVNPTVEPDMTDEPMTTEEFVAKALADGGIRLTSDSYKKELGYGEKERKRFPKMFAKKENGGLSIEEAGEWLMQWDSENGTNFFDQEDANAGRDALINFLGSVRTWGDITGYIRRNREQLAERESEGLRNEVESAIDANYHMTPEEYATLQEVESVENPFGGLDVATKDAIFVEAYEEYEQSLNPKQNDEGRTSEIAEGNGVVLPEERTDNEGGTSERQGERPDLSEGAVQQNDAAQEAEQVEEPITIQEGESPVAFAERVLEEQRRKPLRNRANEWAKALGVKVHFIERLEDVENQAAYLALSNGSKVAGWYEGATGEVFLYMPNLDNVSEVDKTYIHEVVAHKGLREMLGKERFNELCDKVWDMMPDKEKAEFIQYEGVNGDTRAAADEYIAYLAEKENLTPEEQTIWDSIVKMFRDMLDRALNGIIGKSKLTDKDISDLIKASYANLKSGAEGGLGETGTRFSAKKKRALETVSTSRKKHQQTVISSADGAKILNNLDNLAEKYENDTHTKEKTFIGEVAKAIEARKQGSGSQYATFETINGNVVTIRLANHNATVSNFDNRDENEGISIVVSAKDNNGITNDGDAHIVEYFYDSIDLRRADGKPLAEIVKSIKQSLYSGEFKDTTGLAERQEVNESRFRVVNDKNGRKTLVGLHNISEEKLRKAIKQGGLANPSMAVIDLDKQSHVDYGDITLVAPAELIDKNTGRSAGTYMGDAWTPTYPKVTMQLDNKGWKKINQYIESLVEDKDLQNNMKYGTEMYMEGESGMYMNFAFLKAKGLNPEVFYKNNEGYVSTDDIKKLLGVDEIDTSVEGYSKLNELPEEVLEELKLWARTYGNKSKINAYKERLEVIKNKYGEDSEAYKSMAKSSEKLGYGEFDRLVAETKRKERDNGKIDSNKTFNEANYYVAQNGLRQEFEKWMDELLLDAGAKEVFFAGYTPSGNKRYLPNTIENVSKYMNKQGKVNAYDDTGFGATKALFLKKLSTLEEIREQKDRLVGLEEYRETTKELSERMADLIGRLSDMKTISSNKFMNYDYAASRLQESMTKRNPIKHLNDEYGYDLDKKGSFAEDLTELIKDIKDSPARYFETKFERPVYLNEFAAAVVPQGTSKDVVDALTEAGLPIEEYESGNNEARMAAVDKVSSEIGGIRFRFIGEKGARNLDKAEEATTRLDNLAVAKEMEAAEKDAKTIKMATGWERGADGLWRYEVDDNIDFELRRPKRAELKKAYEEANEKYYKLEMRIPTRTPKNATEEEKQRIKELRKELAKLRKGMNKAFDAYYDYSAESATLGEFLGKDNQLFKEYPELADYDVSFLRDSKKLAEGLKGSFTPEYKVIWVDDARPKGDIKSTLVHEIQHAIQGIEGFAQGGTPAAFASAKYQAEEWKANFNEFINRYGFEDWSKILPIEDWMKYGKEYKGQFGGLHRAFIDNAVEDEDVKKTLTKELDYVKAAYDKFYQIAGGMDPAYKFKDANEWYRSLSGEVESRNVQQRMGMTDEQRRNTLAESTEDVAREDQVFLKDGVESGDTRFRSVNEPAVDYVSQANNVVEVPRDEVMYTMNNIANQLYKTSGKFMRQLYKYGTLGRVLKGEYAEIDQIKAKNEYDHAKPILEEYLNELVWMKYQATEAAQEVINDVILDVEYAMQYYKDLSLGKDVWRTQSSPRFRISEKGKQIQAEVDKFTSKYNSKPVVLVDSEMTDEELEAAVPRSSARGIRRVISEEWYGGYSPESGDIYIFADNIPLNEEIEDTLFHENLHRLFQKYPSFVENFSNEKFPRLRKGIVDLGYPEDQVSEELLVRVAARGMTIGDLYDIEYNMPKETYDEFIEQLKAFGYDYKEEDKSRVLGTERQGTGRPLEWKEVYENRRLGENEGSRRSRAKERKERIGKLFDQVADMGLEGVLENKAYTSMMVDIYKALPEAVRTEIADDAIRLYGGSVAPAVSDYIGVKSKESIIDKIVTIVREALRKVGFDLDLNANEVRYMAWRSKKPLDRNNLLEVAEDIDMKNRLKVGEYDGTTPDGGGTRFKVKETKKERIADLRAEIADLKREVTNARKNSQEEWEANQRAIISFIKGKLTKEAGEEFGKYRIDQLLNLVNKATTAKDLRKPFQFIEQVINSAIMDRGAARMEKLIKTKLQGETSRGVAKGVVVDESTRRLFDSIRGTFKDLISTSIDSELRHVRSEILRFGKEINDLPADDIQGRTILTARQEALKERRKELEAEQEELRKNNVVETKESLKKRYDELVDAMDAHIDGKGAWTIEMQDEYDSIPLREKLAEIREAQAQLDDILTDALNTRRAAYGLKGGERKKMLAEADILDSNYSIAQEELIRLMSEVSRDLEEIIKEGKSRLASRREALDERRRKIVSMGIGAVKDRKVIAPNAALTKEEKWHKWFDNSGLKKFSDFMTAPLNSFNFLLKYIDRNHTIGEGELYNYFMKSQEGALEANNRLYDGLKAYNTAIEEKAKEIFGKSIEKVMKDSGKEYNDRVTKQYMFDSTSHREGERYPIRISKGQALYVWLTWRQEDGRAKLLADGWTEESIAEIEEFIGGDYMKFGEWITDEFFPQLREEKYNKTHIEMFGTSMAKREHYFPFKVNAEDIQEKGEMGESYEGMPSTITGNIIKRTINKSRINTEQNAFDLLYKYGNDMETWNAMAKLRQDLNFLHASKAFRNYMEANSKGLFNTFMKAAEVAVKAYNNSAEANPINDFFVKLNRMWAGSNIGFRLNTAMKQILSYPAFMAYSGNPKFQLNLGKYMLNWKGNYDWAKENLPAFRQRIETGDMGMTGMTDPQFDFAKYFKKFTDAGMIPNQLVDALTCAAGARSVYDFEYNQAIKNGLSEEEAKNVAQYNAEVAFNETQQSSREEFVSPIQMSRNVLIKSMMNYQNSNVGYQRMGNEGLLEIMRAKRVYEQDLKNGMNEVEAKKKMANSIARGARKAMVAFTILPGLWYLGGRGIVGITAPLISSLFGGGGDDEPYLDDEAKEGLLVSIGLGTVAGTAGGQLIAGLVQGREYNPMAWMNEMQKDIVGAVNNGWNMNTTKNIALRLAKFGGVNMETWENIYLGAEHAIRTGNFDLVDFMMLINLPASQRKAMAEELYSDMPFMEYADKVSRAQKLFDDYRKYLPYAKTDKNGSKSNAIKKQYIIENLSEEKQDKLEKEKEFKKLQREYGQAEDKAEWLEEHPEYDEMEKDFKSQKVTKEVNREAKKLK